MISPEVRTTAMIGVSAMLLASLLSFVLYLTGVRNDLADVHNDAITSVEAVKQQKEFNKFYEDLYGVDVIATIRDYYDSGLNIVVKESNTTKFKIVYGNYYLDGDTSAKKQFGVNIFMQGKIDSRKRKVTTTDVSLDVLGGTASSSGAISQYKADANRTPYIYTAILLPNQYNPEQVTRTLAGTNSDGGNEYEYKYTPTGEVINMNTSNVSSIVFFTE